MDILNIQKANAFYAQMLILQIHKKELNMYKEQQLKKFSIVLASFIIATINMNILL